LKHFILAALLAPAFANALAQVVVKDAWVRATVPQQKATGAFMQLTASEKTRLVEVRAPIGATAELHEMSLDNDVMRMRQVPGIDLPAGASVSLKPGGYHIMLLGLSAPLAAGQVVPITLVFESAKKQRSTVLVDATVRPLAWPGVRAKP
jgi:copper(I)-binding protein